MSRDTRLGGTICFSGISMLGSAMEGVAESVLSSRADVVASVACDGPFDCNNSRKSQKFAPCDTLETSEKV